MADVVVHESNYSATTSCATILGGIDCATAQSKFELHLRVPRKFGVIVSTALFPQW